MCTSFINRKGDILIGMNFDNNGMAYAIDTKNTDWFIVNVDAGRGKYPSFGVHKNGLFFNNLLVESNGKGLYRRASNKVTHTTKLIGDVLKGNIKEENLKEYLERIEVVNGPDWSCHNMIIDSSANVYIIEPGRGNVLNTYAESDYFIMTNESVIDKKNNHNISQCNRYIALSTAIHNTHDLDVKKSFELLKVAFQNEGDWKTELSMVYTKKEQKVYYCFNGDITQIIEYSF